jgi:hypothetical protein
MFSQAIWTKLNATISANTTTAPNGTLTADSLMETSTTSFDHYMFVSTLPNLSNSHTYSIYLKQNGRRYAQLATVTTQGVFRPIFDLQDGVYVSNAGNNTGATTLIESVGDGWYRCSVILPSNTTNFTQVTVILQNSATYQSYLGDPTKGVYVWGAQLNEGALNTYLPTTTRLNIARIDYSTGEAALLVEPQRTNLLTFSEQFDNASWNKTGVTVDVGNYLSPTNELNAKLLTSSGLSSANRIEKTITVSPSTTYTLSVFIKQNPLFPTLNVARLNIVGVVNTTDFFQNFTANSQWQKITLTYTTASNETGIRLRILRESTQAFSLLIWGAQLEAGAYPTSYIPTTSASVTRNRDEIIKTGISSLIGQSEGTIVFKANVVQPIGLGVQLLLKVSNDSESQLFIVSYVANDGRVAFDFYIGSSYSFSLTSASTILSGVNIIGVVYKAGAYKLYINGSQVASSTNSSPITNTISKLSIISGAAPMYYDFLNVWKTALTNEQLITLTTI